MKTLLRSIVALIAAPGLLLLTGCGGMGGSEGKPDPGYSDSAAEIYRTGQELGALDALGGRTNDYSRHLKSFDSPFVVQFESGYRKGYGSNQR